MYAVSHHNDRHRCHGRPADVVPQAMAGENQYRSHQSDHRAVRRLAARIRHPDPRRTKVRQGLPYIHKRLSSVERFHHRANLQQPIRVGQERPRGGRGGRLRTPDSREEISAFRTLSCLSFSSVTLPTPGRRSTGGGLSSEHVQERDEMVPESVDSLFHSRFSRYSLRSNFHTFANQALMSEPDLTPTVSSRQENVAICNRFHAAL
jgi:hypothetical protein